MACYRIKNANNRIDLICASYNDTQMVIRLFGLYNGSTDGLTVIPREGLESDLSEYQGGELLVDMDGSKYTQRWTRKVSFEENQLQAGGVYMLVTNDTSSYIFRIDQEKYPDLDISHWKFIRSRSLRPILKFAVTKPNQTFAEMPKCYYMSSDETSTKIISKDQIESGLFEDKDILLLPEFTTNVTNTTFTVNTNSSVSGPIRIVNKVNMNCSDLENMTNGTATFSYVKQGANSPASCDILFGFTRVASIEVP